MTTFDRREEAFETMFAHDEEMHFLAVARRNKQLAAWAASLMGRSGSEAESYIHEIASLTVASGSDQVLFERIRDDLAAAKVATTDVAIHAEMDRLLAAAIRDVKQA